jgi:hypothetical protein
MTSILITIKRGEVEQNIRYEFIDTDKFDSHLATIEKDIRNNWLGKLVNVKAMIHNKDAGSWELEPDLTIRARAWLKPEDKSNS